MTNRKLNETLGAIKKLVFGIDIASADSGWAHIYLTKNDVRVKPLKEISFRSNNQNAGKLSEQAIHARRSTHIGVALIEMKNQIDKSLSQGHRKGDQL
jgi:hypothetical protein